MMPHGGQGNQGWNNQWGNQWPAAVVGALGALQNQQMPLLPLMGQQLLAAQNMHYIPAAANVTHYHLPQQWQFNQQTNNAWNQSIIQNTQPPLPLLPPSSSVQPNPPPPAKESTKLTAAHSDTSEEERNFDIQFKEWEQKFSVWKEENKNHPDKKALADYEVQWKGWRQQLIEKRDAMRKAREESNKKELTASSSASQKVGQSHVNKTTSLPVKDHTRNPPPRMDYDNQHATDRSGPQKPFSSDKDTSNHQNDGHREDKFNSPMNSSSNQRLQHETYRDQSTNVHHPHPVTQPLPKDLNKSQQRDDVKPQQSILNDYHQQKPVVQCLPSIHMDNNMHSHQLTERNIPNDVKPLLSALSQDGVREVHDATVDPTLALPPGETPASMFRKRASLGKIPLQQDVAPYNSSTIGASSGFRIEERLAQYADINLSGLPLHRDSYARRSISPIVIDHSVRATVLEPIVFEYNHRPEKRNCAALRIEEPKIIDYAHAKRARETLKVPTPATAAAAAIKPASKVLAEKTVEVVSNPATPEKKSVEASPVKAAPPVQLFPSAAAIEEKELQLAKQQPKVLPNPVAEKAVFPQAPDTLLKADSNVLESDTVLVEDILLPPGRYGRPSKIVVIIRGLPGSGKSHLARLMKEKEVEAGGSAPRILSIDDYFLMDDGSPTPWQEDLEQQYFQNLLKSLKRNLEDGHFPFIIVDALHIKAREVLAVANIARSRAFAVFLIDLPDKGTITETKRKCSEKEVEIMKSDWETAPKELPRLDIKWLFRETRKDKDDPAPEDVVTSTTVLIDEDSAESSNGTPVVSKWEMMEQTGEKLDRLDGITKRKSLDKPASMEDWLQSGLPDDYDQRKKCAEGKKRVRWADVEEQVQQKKIRDLGFVVGQTDWNRMTDPLNGESALTKTKYI